MMMFVVDAGTEDPPVLPIHRLLEPNAGIPPGLDGMVSDAVRVRDMAEVLAGVQLYMLAPLLTRNKGIWNHSDTKPKEAAV